MQVFEDFLELRVEAMLDLGDVLVLLVQGHVGLRGVAEVGHRLRRCGDVVAAVGLDSGHGKDSGTKG